MATLTAQPFSVGEFLDEEREKDLLRFSTAGSVDDGKSTLIGRLLYDTQSVYEDQVRSIEGKGTTAPGQIDFALLTDGLRAEREQGITTAISRRHGASSSSRIRRAMSSTRAIWPLARRPPMPP
jgi:translation elongation factor EF-G